MRAGTRLAAAAVASVVLTLSALQAVQPASKASQATALFAAGCFWCVEEAFDKVTGVIATTSGYTAGRTPNPTYEQVSSGGTGHTEAVQVVYDPSKVTYETLLTATSSDTSRTTDGKRGSGSTRVEPRAARAVSRSRSSSHTNTTSPRGSP